MPAVEDYVGTTSGVGGIVVVGPLSLSGSVNKGPSVVGAAVVKEDRGLDSGGTTNIYSIWIGGCHACQRATKFASAFIRLASNIL